MLTHIAKKKKKTILLTTWKNTANTGRTAVIQTYTHISSSFITIESTEYANKYINK